MLPTEWFPTDLRGAAQGPAAGAGKLGASVGATAFPVRIAEVSLVWTLCICLAAWCKPPGTLLVHDLRKFSRLLWLQQGGTFSASIDLARIRALACLKKIFITTTRPGKHD